MQRQTTMQQIYKFKKADFDNNGFHKDGELFSDLIREWELEFHKEFNPLCANYILANNSTMLLLKSCFVSADNEDYGMDGELDFETNLKIETHSQRQTIYALGSELKGHEDEPLYLVVDDKISDGIIILKHIPDSEDEVSDPIESIDTGIKIKVLK